MWANSWTGHETIPPVEDDRVIVDEILFGMGVVDIDSHPKVDHQFAVEQSEEGDSQLGAKMFQVDVHIRVMFVADSRNLLDLAVDRISMSYRIERGDILLRATTKFKSRHSTNSGIVVGKPTFPHRHLRSLSRQRI